MIGAPFPIYGHTSQQERKGVSAIASYASGRNQIWRETSNSDIGIDGHLEFVDPDGFATGRIVAVQAKSGPSYIKKDATGNVIYYPEKKHSTYWENFPIPVLLILHDPERNVSYWTDVRQELRSRSAQQKPPITIPVSQILESVSPKELFFTAGVGESGFIEDIGQVLNEMLVMRPPSASLPITYFDLFCGGLVNICRSIYYGMDLILDLSEANLVTSGSTLGVGLGDVEDKFLFGFVEFLISQHLAHVNYSDCLIDWVDREMHPHFIAPLSNRGKSLVRHIQKLEKRFSEDGVILPSRVGAAQEGLFTIRTELMDERFDRIRLVKENAQPK